MSIEKIAVEAKTKQEESSEKPFQGRELDVIIPTYHPGKTFAFLLRKLWQQDFPVHKVILMNTEEALFGSEANEAVLDMQQKGMCIEVHHLAKRDFDHAATRRLGVSYSEADAFLCMTDDAIPANSQLTLHLMQALYGGVTEKGSRDRAAGNEKQASDSESQQPCRIAMAYARQLPNDTCAEAERFTRAFNYPAVSMVKTAKDLPRLGIKTYFASNVCCAYDRAAYEKTGGFCKTAIFNEDMIFAAAAIRAGYGIAYAADAEVVHSHNYTAMQQFHRNFDLGVSQAMHPEVFAGLPSEGEGIRLVKQTAKHLLSCGKFWLLPDLIIKSGCKYMGYRLGKAWKQLPHGLALSCAMNRDYLKKFYAQEDAQNRK